MSTDRSSDAGHDSPGPRLSRPTATRATGRDRTGAADARAEAARGHPEANQPNQQRRLVCTDQIFKLLTVIILVLLPHYQVHLRFRGVRRQVNDDHFKVHLDPRKNGFVFFLQLSSGNARCERPCKRTIWASLLE